MINKIITAKKIYILSANPPSKIKKANEAETAGGWNMSNRYNKIKVTETVIITPSSEFSPNVIPVPTKRLTTKAIKYDEITVLRIFNSWILLWVMIAADAPNEENKTMLEVVNSKNKVMIATANPVTKLGINLLCQILLSLVNQLCQLILSPIDIK